MGRDNGTIPSGNILHSYGGKCCNIGSRLQGNSFKKVNEVDDKLTRPGNLVDARPCLILELGGKGYGLMDLPTKAILGQPFGSSKTFLKILQYNILKWLV